MELSDDDKFPGFYPRISPECKVEAIQFFNCINTNSNKVSFDDKNSGIRGLVECKTMKQMYEKCMLDKVGVERLNKRFQVHEEYRKS